MDFRSVELRRALILTEISGHNRDRRDRAEPGQGTQGTIKTQGNAASPSLSSPSRPARVAITQAHSPARFGPPITFCLTKGRYDCYAIHYAIHP